MSATSKTDPSEYVLGRDVEGQGAFTLNALPTAEQYRQMWTVLSEAEEFGLDEIFTAAMDAAHAAHVHGEEVAFDRSTLTWESVGRLALHVDDTRSTLTGMLADNEKVAQTLPYLYEALHRDGDLSDWAPPFNRYGGEYRDEAEEATMEGLADAAIAEMSRNSHQLRAIVQVLDERDSSRQGRSDA